MIHSEQAGTAFSLLGDDDMWYVRPFQGGHNSQPACITILKYIQTQHAAKKITENNNWWIIKRYNLWIIPCAEVGAWQRWCDPCDMPNSARFPGGHHSYLFKQKYNTIECRLLLQTWFYFCFLVTVVFWIWQIFLHFFRITFFGGF